MKKSTLLFIALFTSVSLNAQNPSTIKNSFIIHGDKLTQSEREFYKKSIEAADFEPYRLQTQTVILKFKNGFTLELLPAKNLLTKHICEGLDLNKYSNYPAQPGYKYPLFEVQSTGWITGAVGSSSK